jgi:hypothetical protein
VDLIKHCLIQGTYRYTKDQLREIAIENGGITQLITWTDENVTLEYDEDRNEVVIAKIKYM